MANNQMIQNDSPTSRKKARIDCLNETNVGFDNEINVIYDQKNEEKCVFDAFESVSSTTSDAEIMSCSDSGFQEFMSNYNKDISDDSNQLINNNINNITIDKNCINNLITNPTNYESIVEKAHKNVNKVENEEIDSNRDLELLNELDVDDNESDVSDLSCVSCLSDMSGHEWKPISGPIAWVHKQMCSGTDPRDILGEMIPDNTLIPLNLDNLTLWRIILNMLSEPPPRKKLNNVNTLDDVIQLINHCNRILVLTGAGVSVSCGIPDFRSRDGIYARLSKDFPDLPDPQAMFDIHYFRKDPRPFFKFAKEIYPGQFAPSISHKFIRLMEEKNKLLRNYTQNIDTLEQAAGIQRVITCHGSFATATCTQCKHKVDASFIKNDIFEQRIPKCPLCLTSSEDTAVIKPDIVFFGEGLSDEFHSAMSNDKDECDLLIVMGSSLKVRPVALIPSSIPEGVPQILINREPLNHLTFDVELLGDCDIIVKQLCERLGSDWVKFCEADNTLDKTCETNKLETKKSEEICIEVNNNNSTQMNSSLPFAFSTTVNELRVSDHNTCHQNDKNNRISDESKPDSTDFEEPQSSDEKIASKLTDDKYLYFPPSRYIFKGAEVYNCDLKPHKTNGEISEDDNSNSSLSGSSLSNPSLSSSSSSSSSSSLSTSSSSLMSNSYTKTETDENNSKMCSYRQSSECPSITESETPKT